SDDVIRGPLHTNDALLIDGDTQFLGPVTTSFKGTSPSTPETNRLWRNRFGYDAPYDSDPVFAQGISYKGPLSMPPTNRQIMEETGPGKDGCLYYGPTYIHLRDGQMRVSSPLSASPPTGQPATNAHCRGGNVAD